MYIRRIRMRKLWKIQKPIESVAQRLENLNTVLKGMKEFHAEQMTGLQSCTGSRSTFFFF